MIDTDKYEGPRTEGPWKYIREDLEGDGNYPYADFRAYIVAPPYGTNNRLNGQGRIAMMLGEHTYYDAQLIADAPLLLAEVKRLREENKVLAKYRDIVNKYDDALLADGDEDPRWSELYD